MSWFWGIFDARESESETLSEEGKDGNYTYDKSGTYGQSDYTVREREEGTYDVYIKSDSSKGHSHDHIDSEGNIIDKYHDCLLSIYMMMEQLELSEQKEKTLSLKIK